MSGKIYLTFDDGPSVKITPAILDILEKNNIRATFFITDFTGDKKTDIIRRALNLGCAVGVHSDSHNYAQIYKSLEAFMDDLNSIISKVKNTYGYEPVLYRFPGGSSNSVSEKYCPGIMPELTDKIEEMGLSYFDWTIDHTSCISKPYTADKIFLSIASHCNPNSNNIILLHDSAGNTATPKAVEKLILWARDNNYEFDVLTSDTPACHHLKTSREKNENRNSSQKSIFRNKNIDDILNEDLSRKYLKVATIPKWMIFSLCVLGAIAIYIWVVVLGESLV